MKKFLLLPLLILFLNAGCSSSDDSNTILQAQDIINVAYGTDAQQKIDISDFDFEINFRHDEQYVEYSNIVAH